MPVGFNLFTVLLRIIGITPVRDNKLRFHLHTWIPNAIWLALFLCKLYVNSTDPKSYVDERYGNRSSELNQSEYADGKDFTVAVFFIYQDFIYRSVVVWLLFRKRFALSSISKEIEDIERKFVRFERYEKRIVALGILFIVGNVLLFAIDVALDMWRIIVDTEIMVPWIRYVLILNDLTLSVAETIGAFAVEGLFFYFIVFFHFALREIKDSLRDFMDHKKLETREDDSEYFDFVESKRLSLISLNYTFEKVSNCLTTLLSLSVFESFLTESFGAFYVKRTLFEEDFFLGLFDRIEIKLSLSKLKLLLLCLVSEFPSDEASETYRIVSGANLRRSTSSPVNDEMIFFLLSKRSLYFHFTLGGFYELNKSLLPTLTGVIITYTVLLCQV